MWETWPAWVERKALKSVRRRKDRFVTERWGRRLRTWTSISDSVKSSKADESEKRSRARSAPSAAVGHPTGHAMAKAAQV